MRICHSLNRVQGIVQEISNDRSEILLLLPKGGTVKARNEGFDVGDNICLIVDPVRKKVLKVLPKIIADLIVTVGSNPILQGAIREFPEDLEMDFNEYEFEPEEIIIEEEEDSHGEGNHNVFESTAS